MLLLVSCVSFLASCSSRSPELAPHDPLSPSELEAVVAPIALYPDPLLQRVLTASTFPDQIIDAALFLEEGGASQDIPQKPWERSVKYVANYPSVLTFLADDIDRTIDLGGAFTQDPDEVRRCIQTLRSQAREHGNLKNSTYQTVTTETDPAGTTIIRIEPTDATTIYVPTTTTTAVYEKTVTDSASLWAPLASFGLGVALATALDHDDAFYYGGPFYGPVFWRGGPVDYRWQAYRRDHWHHAYDYTKRPRDGHHHREWTTHRKALERRHTEWRHARDGGRGSTPHAHPPGDGRAALATPRGRERHGVERDTSRHGRTPTNMRYSTPRAHAPHRGSGGHARSPHR